jgi:hypothetical protein
MKKAYQRAILMFALGCVGTVSPMYSQDATPEEAAVAALGAALARPTKLDPRIALFAGGSSEFGEMRSPAHTQRIAERLKAAGVERFENARQCDEHNAAVGEYPWAKCRFTGATSFIGVSKATVAGNHATVYLTIWTHRPNNKVQQISIEQLTATVVRSKNGWSVTKIEGVAST